MDRAPDIATTLAAWLRHLDASHASRTQAAREPDATRFGVAAPLAAPSLAVGALAALAAEALARQRSLRIVTADDSLLPELSNALDLLLRPMCLVLPGADFARNISLRATLSLLKSRLTRGSADSTGPAWDAMRAHLKEEDALWRASLAWTGRNIDREAPPQDIEKLFPVRIGPAGPTEHERTAMDWVILVQTGALPAALCTTWPGAQHALLLPLHPASRRTQLAFLDTTQQLRAELEVLGQELAEMELELATAQGELAAFSARYQQTVAVRMIELDQLRAELADVQTRAMPLSDEGRRAAREAGARAERSSNEYRRSGSRTPVLETPGFAPRIELKKRFRQLAQKIHPDRADNDTERAWRTQLMSEANRAYRAGDANALEDVFALWNAGQTKSPLRAVAPAPSSAAGEALDRQIKAVRLRLAAIGMELDQLYGSKLYELFAAARMAKRQGRDLVAELAARLDTQILLARAELDALASLRSVSSVPPTAAEWAESPVAA